ncbi:MAG: purine-nucleoside phosphorylase, partial [Myxococcales bacterium]|nr:purine-nucleoside phosphorylase [Myxococcales bacterium]
MSTSFDPNDVLARLSEATDFVRGRSSLAPRLAVVAGSGLGALGDLVEDSVRIPYAEIPHMPAPKVEGHSGELVLGYLEGLPIAVLSGRVHAYEGHPLQDVVFGVRLAARLGAKRFLLTNAAGGIHRWLEPGSLCRIVDHINLTGVNALVGPNIDALGPRFPDMTFGYGAELGELVQSAAAEAGVSMFCGVYAGVSGPSYETP